MDEMSENMRKTNHIDDLVHQTDSPLQWAFFAMLGWAASYGIGPNILSQGVRTGPIVTHFGPACTQTMSRSPKFNHKLMAGGTTVSKLWQADI